MFLGYALANTCRITVDAENLKNNLIDFFKGTTWTYENFSFFSLFTENLFRYFSIDIY